MQINITGHHVDVTPSLKDYVNEKFERIQRHFSQITNVEVILTVDKKYQQRAEASMHVPKAELHAVSESEDMYAAIDLLTDKLDRQVIKHKEKLSQRGDGELG